ncbi:RDD family protein [Roseivivax halodurans JCM 10272]|uniref:RDD family protein n=1 Tax=Roseivivax halodurans JCM 10272 TaxID=1449350 RepID=X7EHL1_9RHOB|nr:RDD family protein [Roseivivax halodurans]ETX15584.1 RDD family protein [Roseivivax halodurans JCM 10272]
MYATRMIDHGHLPDPVTQPEFYDGVVAKRAMAWVIDVILVALFVVPVVILTAFLALFVLPVVMLVVGFLYRWITIANGSATWGMRMMAIELRDAYGRPLDPAQAFFHTLGYALSMTTAIVQLGSAGLMCVTERGQGLTDLALGTVMINRRA